MNNEVSFMDVINSFEPAVWWGALAALITFIIEIVLLVKGVIFASGDKKLAKAKKEGRMVRGTMVSCRYKERAPENKTINRMYVAQYEYTLNGQTKTKQVVTTGAMPAHTITLYYEKGGKKVFTDSVSGGGPLQLIIYIIPFIVAYFVMTALGFTGKGV